MLAVRTPTAANIDDLLTLISVVKNPEAAETVLAQIRQEIDEANATYAKTNAILADIGKAKVEAEVAAKAAEKSRNEAAQADSRRVAAENGERTARSNRDALEAQCSEKRAELERLNIAIGAAKEVAAKLAQVAGA